MKSLPSTGKMIAILAVFHGFLGGPGVSVDRREPLGPPMLLAELRETDEAVVHRAVPERPSCLEEKERQKREKAWNMLQHMILDLDFERKSFRPVFPRESPERPGS